MKKYNKWNAWLLASLLLISWPMIAEESAELLGAAHPGEEVLLETLEGVRFGRDEASALAGKQEAGLQITTLDVLEDPLFDEVMSYFLKRPVSLQSISRLESATRIFLTGRGYPYSVVYTPEQDISEGHLRIVVRLSSLEGIDVNGATWFSESDYIDAIKLQRGEPINAGRLQDALARLNRNPFRDVAIVAVPGETPATTRLAVNVREKKPWQYLFSASNTGSLNTGEERVGAGVTWGNAFGLGHQLSLQFSVDKDVEHSKSLFGTYAIDLSARDSLNFNFAHSQTDSIVTPPFDLQGESSQLSGSWQRFLPQNGGSGQRQLTLGFDIKSSDNNFEFGGTPVSNNRTHVVQLKAGYGGAFSSGLAVTSYEAELVVSPGGLTSRNDDDAFGLSRRGASASYQIGRLSASYQRQLPDLARGLAWTVRSRIQYASDRLIGSEQFGAGGLGTVRGYEEGEVYSDHGLLLSHELSYAMNLPVGQLSLSIFEDAARMMNRDALSAEDATTLHSVGVGAQYSFGRLSVSLQYGKQLKDSGVSDSGDDHRLHLSINGAF